MAGFVSGTLLKITLSLSTGPTPPYHDPQSRSWRE